MKTPGVKNPVESRLFFCQYHLINFLVKALVKNLVDFGSGPVFEAAWGQHDIYMVSEELVAGVIYLLCTNGLTGVMSDHAIHECLMPSPIEKAPVLAGATAEKNLTENTSFIIARIY